MSRKLSLRRRSGRETNKTEEDNPPVICIDKYEHAEMGFSQSTSKSNSLAEEKPSSQDRDSSCSPILFPSQEQTKYDKVVKEDEDDCLEIVDKNECADDTKEINTPNNGVPSHSRMHVSKGKTLLSVGKKRHQQVEIDCELTDGNEGNRSKQRKLICEENDLRMKHGGTANASHERESLTMKHPLLLHRTYKCEHRVCQTLEEADKMDLYFAPQGVKQSLYSRVIVRKFEDYRQRLSTAQSRLMHFHPCAEPIEPAPVVPPRRQTARAKRASVLVGTIQELHSLLDGNKANKDTVDLVENSGGSKECNNDVNDRPVLEIIHDNGHTDTNKTENTRTPPVTTNSPPQKGVGLKKDNDVVLETTPNVNNSLESRAPVSESRSSPVKARLSKSIARSILEYDTSSDEDLPSFSLRKPKPPEQTKAKQESVIVLSNEKAPTTSDAKSEPQVPHLECPMCFKMFPEDKIEMHAAGCNGSYEVVTRSARDTPPLEEDEGAECQGVSQRSDEVVVRAKTKEQNKMSPIIKVRTPTKVRELKLLSPNVAVRNLTHELSSQPKPGERVQIFGVNVMLSPKVPCVAKASKSEAASAVVKEVDFRQSRTDGKWLNAKKSASTTPDAQESTQIPHRESSAPTASTKSTKNVRRAWDDKSVKKDFLPLQVWRDDVDEESHENNSLPSKNVPDQTSFVTSISSSEEEECDDKVVCTSSKTFNDVDALDLLINGYKGRKRKGKNVVEQTGRKRQKKPEDDRVELCTICQKLIPIESYTQHVEEELAQKRKECQIVGCEVSTSPRHEPDTSTLSSNLKSRNSKQGETNQRKHMLPDFAEATMSNANKDDGLSESPLKTFMSLDRFPNPNVDYYNQFSTKTSTFESAGRSRGRGRTRRKKTKKTKQKK